MIRSELEVPPRSDAPREVDPELFRKNVRGSSLLLSGRGLAIGVKFFAQILVVRYLSTSEYGAWAYALSVVALLGGFSSLSLNRAISRFAAIYHQRGQIDRFFGTIVLVAGVILGTGLIFAAGLYAFPEPLVRLMGNERQSLALLFVMIFLVPLEALDAVLIAIFATFGRPRAIFVRRYLLTPAVQLSVILLLIARQAEVIFLAYGYLIGALLGVVINLGLLFRILRGENLLRRFRLREIALPAREMFSFSLPLLTEDLLAALVHSSGVLLLGYFYSTEQVAVFRVVHPLATQNLLVIQSFALLYVPAASRLFADNDFDGINDLYWRTAVWIAVLSFPIFAFTFTTATPLTVLLFGARYEESGIILAILAVGGYVEASFGFNRQTLRVLGKIRYIVAINLLAVVTNVVLTLLLVPTFGAIGAAIAMSGTWIANNLLRQTGLSTAATGFSLVDRRYYRSYAVIAGAALALVVVRIVVPHSPVLLTAAAALASLFVFVLTREYLQISDVFPRLARVPLLRVIVG